MAAQVATMAPATMRGTMFGLFNLVVVRFAAAECAGRLAVWQLAGPAPMFAVGAAMTLLALFGVRYLPQLTQQQ